MNRKALRLLAFLCVSASCLAAQQKPAEPKCTDVETPEFQRFNREFISALQHKDAAALSFVISFPLRVNTSRGAILIPDAESLGGHFDQIFTPATVKDILSTGNDVGCRYDMGLSYGRGSAWVSNSNTVAPKNGKPVIALYVINVLDDPSPLLPRLVYSCAVTKHRIVIDEVGDGKFRYRTWDQPKALTAPPDLEIADGKLSFEGTGICAVPMYTFTKGNTEYTVSNGLGCTDGKEPKLATGDLHVTVAGKVVTQAWCF